MTWEITQAGNLWVAVETIPPSENGTGYSMAWFGRENKAAVEGYVQDMTTARQARQNGCTRVCGIIPDGTNCKKCWQNEHLYLGSELL